MQIKYMIINNVLKENINDFNLITIYPTYILKTLYSINMYNYYVTSIFKKLFQ
jgi:hypothetical protein